MSVFEERLVVMMVTIVSLNAQKRELDQLRDRVKNAELLVRKSRPKFGGKRTQIWNDKVVAAA